MKVMAAFEDTPNPQEMDELSVTNPDGDPACNGTAQQGLAAIRRRTMKSVHERILLQAMLRMACRRYIDALCSQDAGRARYLFDFYKRLEKLCRRAESIELEMKAIANKQHVKD